VRAMAHDPYGTLAGIYEWLVPERLLTPEGAVAAFAQVMDALDPSARVLDCAAGIGQLAVGLRLKGFDVVASDASSAMIERTRRLAADRGVDLRTVVCGWEQLVEQGWSDSFDAAFCVGNSLTHAPGQTARRTALGQMAATLRPGGLLVLTSRNWELVRDQGSGLRIAEQLVEGGGRRAGGGHWWGPAPGWGEAPNHDVAGGVIDESGSVSGHVERVAFWPFRHQTLDEDLRAAGFTPASSTYAPDIERYLVTATSAASAAT
jgi:SAM-dependent methyltransferase